MVKIPSTSGANAQGVENRTQLLHDLGTLVALWSQLELHIEIEIARLTKMSPLHASIVLGGLQHKAKANILYSLLRLAGHDETVSKLKTAMSFAKRNALIHSAMASEPDFSNFAFYYRTVNDRYNVTPHKHTAGSFHAHVWEFCRLANLALADLNITEEEIDAYGKAAQFDGLG